MLVLMWDSMAICLYTYPCKQSAFRMILNRKIICKEIQLGKYKINFFDKNHL